MNTRWFGAESGKWVWGVGLLVGLSVLALAVTNLSVYAGSGGQHGSWYSEAAPPVSHHLVSKSGSSDAPAAMDYAKSMSRVFHEAARKVLPSVVTITTTPKVAQTSHREKPSADDNAEEMPFGFKGTPFGDLFDQREFRRFFKDFRSMPNMPHHGMGGAGSGVIVDSSGIILTNNHVVAGGGQVTVRLNDGREFKAVDIKTDPKSDLALVRIKGAGTLPVAKLGDSSKVDVGDWVLALGQPFGLEGTVTAGIVSAKGRGIGITDREDFIQTDAAINPGNSGGPLVNLEGEVVGVNTAISSSSGGYQGVGFAIPINLAKWVGGQLEQGGTVRRAYLGVGIQPVTQPLAEQLKVKVHDGVLVTEVRADSPAAKAGLQTGDLILQFAGQAVSSPRELQGIVEKCPIGSTQSLKLIRDGKEMTLGVTCREMPGDITLASTSSEGGDKGETSRFDQLGIQAENLTGEVAKQLEFKADHGVVITDVRSGSLAEMAGLTVGMVITQANRMPVKSVDDLRKALESKPADEGVLLLVRTAGGNRFVVIRAESK